MTVNGTTTTIDTANLNVTDNVIRVNNGYTGPYFTGGMGIEANRGDDPSASVANLLWDENGTIGNNTTALRWVGGVVGAEEAFATEGVSLVQPDYELAVGTGAGLPTYVTGITVPTPAGGKAGVQIFVNGLKQIEGAGKAYTVGSYAPITVTFTAGNEPAVSDDVEFYGFGTIA